MKVEILKQNLKNGLSVVEKIVGKNLSLPILDNVLLSTEDGFLSLSSTDLETAIKLWILTKIVKNGKAVVPARLFSSFVSLLPNEKIVLEEKKQGLYIECKSFKNQVQGFNPEEFPLIPEFKDFEYLEVDNKKLCHGLSQIVDIAFILPQKPAKEIINILDGKDGKVKIYFGSSQTMFEFPMQESAHPQVQIISRLIEGEYPNYEEIIPKKFKTRVVVKRDEFLNQIKAASLFSGKINEVKIAINPESKEVEIFAQDPDIGESRSTIPAKIEGEAIESSFNYKFLADGLNNIKSSEVAFDMSGEEGPCVLKPIGDTSYIYVVMPIK